MSVTHVAVIPCTRTHSDEEEFQRNDYSGESNDCLMSSRHHSPENEPRSRRNEGETEEKSPDYVPSAQCQI